jgi:hypothetical protein
MKMIFSLNIRRRTLQPGFRETNNERRAAVGIQVGRVCPCLKKRRRRCNAHNSLVRPSAPHLIAYDAASSSGVVSLAVLFPLRLAPNAASAIWHLAFQSDLGNTLAALIAVGGHLLDAWNYRKSQPQLVEDACTDSTSDPECFGNFALELFLCSSIMM